MNGVVRPDDVRRRRIADNGALDSLHNKDDDDDDDDCEVDTLLLLLLLSATTSEKTIVCCIDMNTRRRREAILSETVDRDTQIMAFLTHHLQVASLGKHETIPSAHAACGAQICYLESGLLSNKSGFYTHGPGCSLTGATTMYR